MSFGVQNGQKVPLAPTFLFLGVLSSTAFHSFLSWSPTPCLQGPSLALTLQDTHFVLRGHVFYVCVCMVYTLLFPGPFLLPFKPSPSPFLHAFSNNNGVPSTFPYKGSPRLQSCFTTVTSPAPILSLYSLPSASQTENLRKGTSGTRQSRV